MASSFEISAAACSYAPLAAHRLRRQRSLSLVMAAFSPCGGGQVAGSMERGHYYHGGGGDDEEEPDQLGGGGHDVAAARPGGAGVALVVRALWRRIVSGRRRKATVSRSGGSSAKEQYYGQEEYEQNFDEGVAAAEPDNLSRSFSARYACRRRSLLQVAR